ncbi:MAG: hypothetical protein PHQ54_00215 [Candidatus Omnitrophica bacterium]|nr:hypothetical protein [Candidatus Omnitrophota bacterium]
MVFTHFKNNGLGNSDDFDPEKPKDKLKPFQDSEIIDLLYEGLDSLERGIQGVGKRIPTPVGMIDMLAVDMIGRFVIVEVGRVDADDLIFKSIDHFDWAFTNMKNLEEKYKSYNIDPTLAPRIVILSPSYSEKFVKRANYLNPTFIDIYEYQINEALGAKKIYFRPFSFINHKKWVVYLRTKSVDDHLKYIENSTLRETLKNFLVEFQSVRSDCTVDTSCGYLKFKDKNDGIVLSIYVLKNAFWVNWNILKWDGKFIVSKDDFQIHKSAILHAVRKEA